MGEVPGLARQTAAFGRFDAVMHNARRQPSRPFDPGWVPTRMGGPGATDDLAAGHRTQVWPATHDDVTPPTGGYWCHQRTLDPHPTARDPSSRTGSCTSWKSAQGFGWTDRRPGVSAPFRSRVR